MTTDKPAAPDVAEVAQGAILRLLARREGEVPAVTADAHLQDDLDLDSLELAELSVMLEDEYGHDPYTAGVVPRTVAEIAAFYA